MTDNNYNCSSQCDESGKKTLCELEFYMNYNIYIKSLKTNSERIISTPGFHLLNIRNVQKADI